MTSTLVRTRIAPSPTGEYHIGHLRTCLYDYALARQSGGQFVIRIEDTDRKRFVDGATQRILDVIHDYGLTWDEGPDVGGPYAPYIQSERLNTYQPIIQQLIDNGHAYYCFCTEARLEEMRAVQKASKQLPRYDRHCLHLTPEEIKQNLANKVPFVIRLRVPDKETVEFNDLIRGRIKFNTSEIDDQVLVKSNGIPTYHFAVVVDDHLMNITHIFRGEEWITSTPKQILLYRFLGWEVPVFAHLTVLLDPGGHKKMSKRTGSVSARAFLDEGYLPEAMLNFLMLLGWNPGNDKELFTLDEFVKEFSLDHLHKKSPVFDRKKLDYFNGLYIRKLTDDKFAEYFKKFLPGITDEQVKILTPVLKERIVKFSDIKESLKFLFEDVVYTRDLLLKKGTDPSVAAKMLEESKKILNNLDNASERLQELIKVNGWNTGEFFMVFRVAICGVAFTPPVVECLPALGVDGTIRKLDIALNLLK